MGRKLKDIPDSLLNGCRIHCRPRRRAQIVEAVVTEVVDGRGKKVIVCPARVVRSGCLLRQDLYEPTCRYPESTIIGGDEIPEEKEDD